MYNAIMTNAHRVKLSRFMIDGLSLKRAAYVVFGDGGNDANNKATLPDAGSIKLNNELLRKNIASSYFDNAFSCSFVASIEKTELNGKLISEIGVLDTDGELIALQHIDAVPKDNTKRFELTIKLLF